MSLFVGTSGWAYPEWQPTFYPAGLARARYLSHYATVFGMCEVNATHYRVQSPETVAGWIAAVPPTFVFAVKAHRALLAGWGEADAGTRRPLTTRFLTSLDAFGHQLAAVLLKVPAELTRDDDALTGMLGLLQPYRVVVEFEHASWHDPAVAARVADAGGTVCLTDETDTPPAHLPAGPLAYVRLRARHYDPAFRARWRALLEHEATARDVFAVARHKDLPADDPHAGLGLARWLASPEGAGDSALAGSG